MKNMISFILSLSIAACLLSGCSSSSESIAATNSLSSEENSQTSQNSDTDFSQSDDDMFTERDLDGSYDESGSVSIQLNGDTVSASSDSVKISDSTVTITEEAVYIISGTLEDGMIIVDADDSAKIQLVLDGTQITSSSSAPLYILEADKVFVTLAENSENTLENGGSFTAIDDSNIDAAVYSRQDLTLNGSGSLTVSSPAGHGIVSNDDLVLTGGTYTVTSSSHGLKANDSIRVTGNTSITASAGKDGFHAENDEDTSLGFIYFSGGSVNVEAEGDGISAGSYMQITDGSFDILAGGGSENAAKESSDSWGDFKGGRGDGQFRGDGGQPRNITPPDSSLPDGAEPPDADTALPDGAEPPDADTALHRNMAAPASTLSAQEPVSDSSQTDTEDDSSTSMKGLKSSSDLMISGGTFTINSADDSVHSNTSIALKGGSFEIASGDDAFHSDDSLTVSDASINITKSYEGMEALHLSIHGGDITLISDDDGLNAAGGTDASGVTGGRDAMFGQGGMASSDGTIIISGGTIDITASGDGIDANGSLEISGGNITVTGPTQGDTATLDYDTSAVITGGTFIGTGAAAMAESFSDSEQGVAAITLDEQSAGTEITLTDKDGAVIFTHSPSLPFSVVILSSPDLESGETYTLTAGSVSEDITAA